MFRGIQNDIEKHQECEFDDMLKVFLLLALERKDGDMEEYYRDTLMKDVLHAMLPVCAEMTDTLGD